MLLMASMALAAIAFAAPMGAQAKVQLTDSAGQPLDPGDPVTATSANLKMTTAGGTIECAHVVLHFLVGTNGNNHVVLEQQGVATTTGCVLNRHALGLEPPTVPVTITDGTVGVGAGGVLTINTWGQGSTAATFQSHIGAATCHFSGNVSYDVTHPSPNDKLNVTPSVLAGAGIGCPPAGTISGEFTLEDAAGAVNVDFVATT
jgi:hypothetical protein